MRANVPLIKLGLQFIQLPMEFPSRRDFISFESILCENIISKTCPSRLHWFYAVALNAHWVKFKVSISIYCINYDRIVHCQCLSICGCDSILMIKYNYDSSMTFFYKFFGAVLFPTELKPTTFPIEGTWLKSLTDIPLATLKFVA